MLKPRPLEPGDSIGIVAPAGPLWDEAYLLRGIERLQSWGFRVVLNRPLQAGEGYLAGSDEERLAELEAMFASPEIKALICLRGGYGSLRLLPHLHYALIRSHPKIFVGYSDITALHLAIVQEAGLVVFHGPMIYPELGGHLTSYTKTSLLSMLTGSPGSFTVRPLPGKALAVSPGRARGRLIGGNLSLLVSTLGTPFEIDTRGAILFWEEVDEPAYRVDRMLTQLRLAGKLSAAAGIAVGECIGCGDLEELLRDRLAPLGIPCLYGLPCGHGTDIATLPLGVYATLDADQGYLRIEEPPWAQA
ncbi:S66 peptidase family protein [Thermanaeromonas sp. C210]|uniref:S66 peptidase family protein n=1 Tax=Thermanaeromonas sp. C210 TaxID=2731925 RepID=UPI00155B6797|nr:LD-carboxypeptidase [Thermanaeromonas sp. C210]GFN24213.1 peptidase U61 [Thermanaeromonas sp. C210]